MIDVVEGSEERVGSVTSRWSLRNILYAPETGKGRGLRGVTKTIF